MRSFSPFFQDFSPDSILFSDRIFKSIVFSYGSEHYALADSAFTIAAPPSPFPPRALRKRKKTLIFVKQPAKERNPVIRNLLLATLLFAVGALRAQQQELPWLSPGKDASGRAGYFDDEGNNVIPCVFDHAAHFPKGHPVAYVRHEGRCYLIDRTGGRVTEEAFEDAPQIWPHFFLTRHYGSAPDRLVGFDGVPISPEKGHVVPVQNTTDRDEPLFFALREEGKSTFRLVDLSFRPIAPIRAVEFERTIYAPELIRFRTDSGYGLLNAEGKVILPAQYSSLDDRDIAALYGLEPKLRKAGCWSDELGAVVLFVAERGTTLALFDETGRQVVPPFKAKYVKQLIDKAFKTHLLPYARCLAETRQRIEQVVKAPFAARLAAHERLAAALPAPRRHGSMVDFVRRAEEHPDVERHTPAECLRRGRELVAAQRYDRAVPWLERAAEAKVQEAYFALGECYAMKNNPRHDPKKAHYWLGVSVGCSEPSSRDYWFACYLLGAQFEHGNGCDRNLTSALHFYRRFRDCTTAENRPLAEACIARVQQLQRQGAAAPSGRPTTSAGGTNRAAAAQNSGSRRTAPPTGGTCYWTKPQTFLHIAIEFRTVGGQQIISPTPAMPYFELGNGLGEIGGGSFAMLLLETTNEAFVYKAAILRGHIDYGQMPPKTTLRYEHTRSGPTIRIARDLSWVRYSDGTEGETRIDEAEYRRIEAGWKKFVAAAEAYGGGGGESGAVEVESGMSASYYRSMYDRWAGVAESAYRSLTAAGVSVRDREGNRAGSAAGSWQGSRYAGMKSELSKAQSAMRRIRSEAARAGHSIGQSPWETATVSY